ncbi:MAG: Na/Pi cotransporter family protein [Christensenellales bacterium]|nr:Na/Pi cotransporter family protein [Christensenellales bacterium]
MDIFGLITMLGGLALFLYGMDLMGKSLERQAGSKLQTILERLAANRAKGLLLGIAVTAVIQSSSATTVMVVGFVNSGVMKLGQACGIIMGANVGTTVTSWLLSLTGIEGSSVLLRICNPSTFSPVLALIGIIMFMFTKRNRLKNIGTVLLGFAILMFGMQTMSDAVKPLADNPQFTRLFTLFSNPILGILIGALLTGIIQSSSASVGILQALSATGAITYSSAIPIIMGQNIGTCATALISSIGANRNARRAAFIHLYFNIFGVAIFLTVYQVGQAVLELPFLSNVVNGAGIATVHTCFNVLATAVLLPFAGMLEKLARITVRKGPREVAEIEQLDARLLNTPSFALEQSRRVSAMMARETYASMMDALKMLEDGYDDLIAGNISASEDRVDRYEDMLGSYLVRLSACEMNLEDSRDTSMLLHQIGDIERISDHTVNLMEVSRELMEKGQSFSSSARREISVLIAAVRDIMQLTLDAFVTEDISAARRVEPLEQWVDELTKELKSRHIERLQEGTCTIQMGFVLTDLTVNCERVADHCSNIAATMIESSLGSFDMHDYTDSVSDSAEFQRCYQEMRRKYRLPAGKANEN